MHSRLPPFLRSWTLQRKGPFCKLYSVRAARSVQFADTGPARYFTLTVVEVMGDDPDYEIMSSYKILAMVGLGALFFILLQILKSCVSTAFGRNVAMSDRIIACTVMILFLTGFGIVTAVALDP